MTTKRRFILLLTATILTSNLVLLGSSRPVTGVPLAEGRSDAESSGRIQDPDSDLRLEHLRFIGEMPEDQNASALDVLTEDRAKLLFAFREPASLDEVLRRGHPFSSEHLLELRDWGLLVQEGNRFRATIPMLVSADAEAFRQQVREITPVLVTSVAPAFEDLYRTLANAGDEQSFAVVATWILRERVWHHLVANGTIAVQEAVDLQRSDFPRRGWWGTFWYIDPPNDPIVELRTVRSLERTMQLAWRLNELPEGLSGLRGSARAAQFMAFVDEDRGRLRNPEVFSDLLPFGWHDADGTLRLTVHEWTPARPGTVAAAAETAATTVAAAVAVLRQLARELGDELGLPQAIAAYLELAPELMRSLDGRGLSILNSSRSDDSEEQPEPRQISAVIWMEFPEEGPALRLPW